MNLHKLSVVITKKEGGKVSLPIGQVKEVMKLFLIELAKYSDKDILTTIKRYK